MQELTMTETTNDVNKLVEETVKMFPPHSIQKP